MTKYITKHTRSFDAIDEDGNAHTLHCYQEMIDAGTFDNPNATIPGLMEIETDDGRKVNHKGKGEYEIVQTGQILRTSDPDAP